MQCIARSSFAHVSLSLMVLFDNSPPFSCFSSLSSRSFSFFSGQHFHKWIYMNKNRTSKNVEKERRIDDFWVIAIRMHRKRKKYRERESERNQEWGWRPTNWSVDRYVVHGIGGECVSSTIQHLTMTTTTTTTTTMAMARRTVADVQMFHLRWNGSTTTSTLAKWRWSFSDYTTTISIILIMVLIIHVE